MIGFREVDISDKCWIKEKLSQLDSRGSEYTFGNIFAWAKISGTLIADVEGFFVTYLQTKDQAVYTFPAGNGDLAKAVLKLYEDAKERGNEFKITCISENEKDILNSLFPDRFEIQKDEKWFDYIYNKDNLINLTGKKYHGKRNHITRFIKNNPDWSFEPITEQNIEDCKKMNAVWCAQNDCMQEQSKREEACAVKRSLKYYFDLDYIGGLIRANGEVIAFTMGEMNNSDTFIVHIEKAFSNIQGAYPIINREFIKYASSKYDFQYVNREDDAESEGLRKAKMSYNPVFFHERYVATLKEPLR